MPQTAVRGDDLMKILVVNVNTSRSMTDVIGEAARRYAPPGTAVVALWPYFGAEAVDRRRSQRSWEYRLSTGSAPPCGWPRQLSALA
jgi:hypothetical protein